MMLHEDWIMRQIQQTIYMLAKVFFKKEMVRYEILDESRHTRTDLLHERLMGLIADKEFNAAENLLFEAITPPDLDDLRLAMDFYARLNGFSQEELEESGFSRAEVMQGLADVAALYGLSVDIYGLE